MKTHPADRELAAAVRAASVAELCAALRNRASLGDVVWELRHAAWERHMRAAAKAWAAWQADETESGFAEASRLTKLEDRAWRALERAYEQREASRPQPLNMTRKRALQLQRAAEGLCVVHVPPARGKGAK